MVPGMPELNPKEIGRRIALARKEAGGMTQDQLADLLDVSTRSVQEYEAGIRVPWRFFPRLEEIYVDKTLRWFLYGEQPPSLPSELFGEQLRLVEVRLGRLEELAQALLAALEGRGGTGTQ